MDHWSAALALDVTSIFYANYQKHGGVNLLLRQKIKPVCKDMLYVQMLRIALVGKSVKLKQELVQRLQKIVACVQDSRHKGYFCNDCQKSLRRNNSSELAEILHPDPE